MGIDRPIDITSDQRKTLLTLLERYLPNTEAWVYGSRVKWTSRPQSDLDLVVFAAPEQARRVSDLREAFEESNLPFRVDLFVWDSVPEQFRKQIETEHVVLVTRKERSVDDGWTECRLADACSSPDYGLTASASSGKTGPHFLRITDIVSGHIDWKSVPHVVVEDDIEQKYRLYDGDIVIARTGASTGASVYVKNPPPAVFASYLVRLQAKPEFDARFLAYFLKSEEFWEFIRGVLGDKSAQPNASASTMTAAPLRVPKNKNEQRAIAHILGTLDDKIELNRRMNETLEAMARALFKSWFVDFDPVRAKAALKRQAGGGNEWTLERALGYLDNMGEEIAALFPDSFVDSELGGIPEGWKVKALGDLLELAYGKALKADNRQHDGKVPVYGSNGQVGWHDESLIRGPGIVVGRKGNPGVVTWVTTDFFPIDTTFYVVPKDNNDTMYFLFYALHDQDLPSVAADSAVPGLNRNLAYMSKQVMPGDQVIPHFNKCLGPIFARSHGLKSESVTLAVLRDTLLPRLISGKLQVGNEVKGYLGKTKQLRAQRNRAGPDGG